jgi:uncharacterized protein YndB with AHSA1/START domain
MNGTYELDGNISVIRFERDFRHPLDKVWTRMTSELTDWLTKDGSIELRVGGRVTMSDHEIETTVVALDPPRMIEYGWAGPNWDGGTVRWELAPTTDGTKLTLTHRFEAMTPEKAEEFKKQHPDLPDGWEPRSSTLAGWHTILDAFATVLDGGTPKGMEHWIELNDVYKERIGIS